MAKANVRQHFIPQCYLRNFSENKKFVFVHSKKNKKNYPQAIEKTACLNYFYTIPEKYIKKEFLKDIDTNFIEKKILANNIESFYSALLSKIIQAASIWTLGNNYVEILNKKERDLFAALIAIQYLRMPNIRDKYWSAQRKVQKERNEIVSAMQNAYKNIDSSVANALNKEEDYSPVLHSEIFLDEELITNIQDQITKKIWIYKMSNKEAVYTSDNPILLKSHIEKQTPFYEGFGMNGVEIIFPISKNIILTIWDEKTFVDRKTENNKFGNLTDVELRQYNCYQYIWADDEVYSIKNDFKLIELLKIANGNIDTEIIRERPRIKVNGK